MRDVLSDLAPSGLTLGLDKLSEVVHRHHLAAARQRSRGHVDAEVFATRFEIDLATNVRRLSGHQLFVELTETGAIQFTQFTPAVRPLLVSEHCRRRRVWSEVAVGGVDRQHPRGNRRQKGREFLIGGEDLGLGRANPANHGVEGVDENRHLV